MRLEDIFQGMTFKDEQEVWAYLITLRDLFYVAPNGIYIFDGPVLISQLEFTEYFPDRETYRRETGDRIIKNDSTCFIELVNGYMQKFSFGNLLFGARQRKANGEWFTSTFEDRFETDFYLRKEITQKQIAEACQALIEAMVMNPKKVDEGQND